MSHKNTKLALGLGCDRNTPVETMQQAIAEALQQINCHLHQVQAVATIDLKTDEAAMLALGQHYNWRIIFYSATQLAQVQVPNPSEVVRKYTGTPSVSEAAALLAAGNNHQAAGVENLLVEKHKLRGDDGRNATVSIAQIPLANQQ